MSEYTKEQENSAEEFLNIRAGVPEENRPEYNAVVTAFISGMEAQRALEKKKLQKEAG